MHVAKTYIEIHNRFKWVEKLMYNILGRERVRSMNYSRVFFFLLFICLALRSWIRDNGSSIMHELFLRMEMKDIDHISIRMDKLMMIDLVRSMHLQRIQAK